MAVDTKVRRLALVIGNGAYTGASKLKNPSNDATAIGKKLIDIGFEVRTEIDATGDKLLRAIGEFTRQLSEAQQQGMTTAAVLFYAGHGVQVDGENYLLPIDAEIQNKLDLQARTVGLHLVLEALGSVCPTNVVLLDCCRNNPLPRTLEPASRSLAAAQGLANVRAPKGVYVAFATQPHFVALDGAGSNSPFTEALLEHMDDPGQNVSDVLMDVRKAVYDKTSGQQIPWDHSALFEPFRFVAGDTSRLDGLSDEARARVLGEEAEAREESYWKIIPQTKDVAFIHSFVTQFPNSKYRAAALARIDSLKANSQWYRVLRLAGAGVAALLVLGLFTLYMLTKTLPDTNILMGDIINEERGEPGFEESYLGCRLRCVLDRFGRPCVAFSYSLIPIENKPDADNRRCFPKYEAVFSFAPSKANSHPTTSELMPSFFRPAPVLQDSRFFLRSYRTLAGEPVDFADASRVIDNFKQTVSKVTDEPTGRTFWVPMASAQCQTACTDLGGICRGFSYFAPTLRCELFKSVKGILRDSLSGRHVFMPGTVSGCDDPNAAVDKETQQDDCLEATGGGFASSRTRTPAGAVAPGAVPAAVAPPKK